MHIEHLEIIIISSISPKWKLFTSVLLFWATFILLGALTSTFSVNPSRHKEVGRATEVRDLPGVCQREPVPLSVQSTTSSIVAVSRGH